MPGKRGGAERPRTRHARRKTREAREPGGRGEWREGARPAGRPGRAPRPAPRRGRPIARTLSVHEGRSAPPPPRGGPRRGRERAAEPPLPPPPHPPPPTASPPAPGGTPPRPRPHRGRPTRALGVRPSHPPQRGGGRRPARTRRPARGGQDRGPDPRSGERTGAGGRGGAGEGGDHGSSPSSSTRRRRRTGGGETGNGSGPRRARKRDTPGRGPGRQQTASGLRRTDRRRGAPTGCGHARPTPRNRGGVGGAAARHREGHGSKRPVLGQGEARVGRQGPPRDLTAGGLPAQGRSHRTPGTTDWRPPPGTLTGAHAHRHRHTPESRKPARENALPPRTGGPHVPHTRKAPRAPPRLGDATGRRRPGDDTHMRRGRLGPRQGKGARGGRTRGTRRRGRQRRGGAGKHARRGPRDRAAGAIRGPQRHREHGRATRKTSAGSHRHPHTRAVPRHAWDADRSRPAPERAPTTRPRRQGRRAAQTHLPPPVLDRSVFRSKSATPRLDILGITLSSEAAPTVTARRHRLRLVGRGRAR